MQMRYQQKHHQQVALTFFIQLIQHSVDKSSQLSQKTVESFELQYYIPRS